MNDISGQIYTYPSSSSPSASAAAAAIDPSYLSLNMLKNNNNDQLMGGLIENDNSWKLYDSSPDDRVAVGHYSLNTGPPPTSEKINKTKPQEKKIRKQPKHAFQTRSQVDILDDGYRWRKYGQKAVKNNKFPRNYYRCTHQGCNVKKQVQRLSNDDGVVVTTYEGVHSHGIEKSTDNFENILTQMQIYPSPYN